MAKIRKQYVLSESEVEKLERIAAGASLSSVLAGWTEEYLAKGSTYRRPGMEIPQKVQVIIDPEVQAQAEARAKREGVDLREVLRHRLSKTRV